MRKAIGTLAGCLIAICMWGQQPSAQSEAEKLAAVASLFGPIMHKEPVDCSKDKACSATNKVPPVNNMIDKAFAQSAAEAAARGETPREMVPIPNFPFPSNPLPSQASAPVASYGQNITAAQNQGAGTAAPQAAQTAAKKARKFDPNEFRPNVKWEESHSTHFDIYTQKVVGHIGSANLAMTFETSYETLRRFIPWMMSARVRVFVYQDERSYLKNEPEARSWTRALAYPFRGEIVVYDIPGKAQELKEVFTHELTHIFTQQFFDNSKNPKVQPPLWLDEGLAVLVEDQAYAGANGGPWNNDYLTRSFVRARNRNKKSDGPLKQTGLSSYGAADYASDGGFSGKHRHGAPIRLMTFNDFIEETSLSQAEAVQNTQNWYLQAYLMVRFLLNPSGASSPTNRMQFERFTRLLAHGEAARNPSTGQLVVDANGRQVYQRYDLAQALARTYRYNSVSAFENAFWQWLGQ